MEKETKCMIGEQIGEVLIGGAMAVIINKTIFPKLDGFGDKLIVTAGTSVGAWMIGRAWAKSWLKFCDQAFDTDFEDVYEEM